MGNMRVKQPLPAQDLEQMSPFILLHHAGPDHYEAGEYKQRLGSHPHRGFEPVTFIFNGKCIIEIRWEMKVSYKPVMCNG